MGWQDAPLVEGKQPAWMAAKVVDAPASPPENPTSAGNLFGAATEPMLSMATGALAAPVSGLAGIGTAIGNKLGLTDKDPADVVRSVGGSMTYQPRTTGGKNAMTVINAPLEKIAEGADWAGGHAAEITGSPAVGAAVNTAIQAVPQVMLGKTLAKNAPIAQGKATISPEAQLLVNKGVTLTPGELKGGNWSRAEQRMESFPLVGDMIRNARGKGVEQFGIAAINDALEPIGAKVPAGTKGHLAISYAQNTLGHAYDRLLPKLTGELDAKPPVNALPSGQPGAAPKLSLREELDGIKQMGTSLPPEYSGQLNRIIDNEVVKRFTPQGKASGETLKMIESQLGAMAKTMTRSENYDVRTLGGAVQETQAALRRMVEDVNPGYGKELAAVNEGYAKFKIAQRAAGLKGAKEGVFTPSQYLGAVRAKDASKDHSRYAKGVANQQTLAEAGDKVLSRDVPDSGTSQRLLLLDLLLGGAGHAAVGPGGIAAGLAIPALYSQMSLRALQPALLSKKSAGNATLRALPYGSMESGNSNLSELPRGYAR